MYRHHLEKLTRTRLDDILVDEGCVDRPRLEAIQAEQDQTGALLTDILVTTGGFDEWELAKLQVNRYGLPFLDVKLYAIRREVAELLPPEYCRKRGILALDQFGQSLAIACWEVPSPELLAEIIEKTGLTVFLYIGVRRMILEILDEQAKKAAGRSMSMRSAQSIAGASIGGANSVASGTLHGASAARTTPQPAPAAFVAPPPPVPAEPLEPALPPLDLPPISMKLNASAQSVSAPRRSIVDRSATDRTHADRAPGERPVIDRFPRPTPTAATPTASPLPQPAAAHGGGPALPSPVQRQFAPAAAAARPAAAPVEDSLRPRIARAAPVIPLAKPAPAAPQKQTGWESIFDIGESAVRQDPSGEAPPKKPLVPSQPVLPPSDRRPRS